MKPSAFSIISDSRQTKHNKKDGEGGNQYVQKRFDEYDLDNYLEEL